MSHEPLMEPSPVSPPVCRDWVVPGGPGWCAAQDRPAASLPPFSSAWSCFSEWISDAADAGVQARTPPAEAP
jgi:hypothetical protein